MSCVHIGMALTEKNAAQVFLIHKTAEQEPASRALVGDYYSLDEAVTTNPALEKIRDGYLPPHPCEVPTSAPGRARPSLARRPTRARADPLLRL